MAARRTALALALLLSLARPAPAEAQSRPLPAGPLAGPADAAPSNEAPTLADFVAALEPHGTWSEHPRHGPVWRPTAPGADWSPYLRGRWTHTSAGWYWVGEEPWAWATSHFGRWYLHAAAGWTWVPGRRWAPAWVIWREGKGLVGWAPLQPDGAAHPLTYLFVEAARMREPAYEAVLPPARGGEAMRATRVLEAPGAAPDRRAARSR